MSSYTPSSVDKVPFGKINFLKKISLMITESLDMILITSQVYQDEF